VGTVKRYRLSGSIKIQLQVKLQPNTVLFVMFCCCFLYLMWNLVVLIIRVIF